MIKFHGNTIVSMAFLWELHGIPKASWQSMEYKCGNTWKIPWNYMLPWISMESHGTPYKLHWFSMEIPWRISVRGGQAARSYYARRTLHSYAIPIIKILQYFLVKY